MVEGYVEDRLFLGVDRRITYYPKKTKLLKYFETIWELQVDNDTPILTCLCSICIF